MEKLVFKGIESIVISENIVYYIYDVRKLDITLAGKKLRDKSIVYLYTADEGDVQINIIGSSKSIDTSSMTNGKCYKLIVNATSDIDFEELNEANEGGDNEQLPLVNEMPSNPSEGDMVIYAGADTSNYSTGHIYRYDGQQWNDVYNGGGSSEQITVMTNAEFEEAYNNNTLPYGDIIITGYVPATYFHNSISDDYDENETYSYSDAPWDNDVYVEYYVSNYSNDSIRIKHYGNGIIDKQCKIIHNNIEYYAECRYYENDEIKYINLDYYGMYVEQQIHHKTTKGFYIYKMHVNTNIFPCNIFCNYNSYYDYDHENTYPIDFFGQKMNDQNYFNIGLSENVYNNICKANNDIKYFIIFKPNFLLQKTLKFEIGNNIVESGAFVVLTGYYEESNISGYSDFYPEEFIVKDNVFKYKSNIRINGTCFIGNVFDEYSHIIISIDTWLTGNTEDGTFNSIFNYNVIGKNTNIYKCMNTVHGISEFTYNKIGKLCLIGVGDDEVGDAAFNCNEIGDFTVIGDYNNYSTYCAAFGNVSYNKIGSRCDIKILRQGCYGNTIGDYCRNLYVGLNFKNNSIGNDYVAENNTGSGTTWTIGNNVENCHIGNGCNSIRFGDNCGACSIGDNSSYIDMGSVTYSVHIGADCNRVAQKSTSDYWLNCTVADHARNLNVSNLNYVDFSENATGSWDNITYGNIGGDSYNVAFVGSTELPIENLVVSPKVTNLNIEASSYADGSVLKNIRILPGDYMDNTLSTPAPIYVMVDVNKDAVVTIGYDSNDLVVTKYLLD